MRQPLISIIIPTYNRAHLIGETLDSVLAQTYQNWECIVVDDGSTDYTEELMEFYCERDERIQYHHRPEYRLKGANACRNLGLELGKGEFIQFLDSDDLLSKNKLEVQLKMLRFESGGLATCCWGSFGNSAQLSKKIRYNSFKNYRKPINLLETFGKMDEYFPPHVYLTSKELILKAGSWNERLIINQDGEFFTRVIINASKIVYCSSATAYYRYGSDKRTSVLDNKKKIFDLIKSWKIIEQHLNAKNPTLKSKYVKNGKKNVYKKVTNRFPEIIEDNKFFFREIKSKTFFHDLFDIFKRIKRIY